MKIFPNLIMFLINIIPDDRKFWMELVSVSDSRRNHGSHNHSSTSWGISHLPCSPNIREMMAVCCLNTAIKRRSLWYSLRICVILALINSNCSRIFSRNSRSESGFSIQFRAPEYPSLIPLPFRIFQSFSFYPRVRTVRESADHICDITFALDAEIANTLYLWRYHSWDHKWGRYPTNICQYWPPVERSTDISRRSQYHQVISNLEHGKLSAFPDRRIPQGQENQLGR
jgi:hypothetical protein